MSGKSFVETENNKPLNINDIPVLDYKIFMLLVDDLLQDKSNHCVNYFAVPYFDRFRFFCCIANDLASKLFVLSHEVNNRYDADLLSITKIHFPFHVYEREIYENYGIEFSDHPWMKPIRFAFNRVDKSKTLENYPFYTIDGEELHEVGVGPIHAGVIEPGHFRFICNGEKVLHLEIQLGYQHRGIESLMVNRNNLLKRTILSETIAGDTTIGHSLAFVQLMEGMGFYPPGKKLSIERVIALELERIAIHIGDTGALCMDVAYQLGQAGCEALRTIVINTLQSWCGNRFGKGLMRTGGTNYPITNDIAKTIRANLEDVAKRYDELADRIFSLPSILLRFEQIGVISRKQAELIGAVGMAARMTGLRRDIRKSHPSQYYTQTSYEPVTQETGDVFARGMLRRLEIEKSIELIFSLLDKIFEVPQEVEKPLSKIKLKPSVLTISLIEGWRGEICHAAITDEHGEIAHYKIKDPSLHNWMALALAVREQEISDFPICNKSFNLSYCGHDL